MNSIKRLQSILPDCRFTFRSWTRPLAIGLLTLCLAPVPLPAQSDDSTDAAKDDPLAAYKSVLETAGIKPTVEDILAHLKRIAPTDAALKEMDVLLRQLGASSYTERNKAQRQLAALGILAESRVREAAKSADPEVMGRAEAILKEWSASTADTALLACFRSLIILKPEQAVVPAVLGVLPLCGKPYLGATAEETLLTLARTNDLPALKQVIEKGNTPERCIVVPAYARLLGTERATELDPLLAAKEPQLRLAAARALANLGLFKAAGVLVDLLEHDDVDIRSASFICLLQFTKQDFKFSPYGSEDTRKGAVAAWRQWLASDGKTAPLTFPLPLGGSISYLLPGHILIAMGNNQRGAVEFDADGKEVWSYPFQNCWTAQRLANGNTLLSSHSAGIVEVTPDKKTVWEYGGSWIKAVQLENGNVLAVSQGQTSVNEIRKLDKSIAWNYSPAGQPVSAIRMPNGNTLIGCTGGGRRDIGGGGGLSEVTPEKKVIWSYQNALTPYGLQLLPNGNLLITDYNSGNGVFELDRKTERKVWEHKVNGAIEAFRTIDGNTLITTGSNVIEITPEKKTAHTWSGNSYGSARR